MEKGSEQKRAERALERMRSRMEPVAARLFDAHAFPREPKIIHDCVWGTQLLHAHEVAVVDLPLLQRLRNLCQTGFTYLTYPSTSHTRFDHTLGVLRQVDRLMRALNEADPQLVSRQQCLTLRMAALLHDCSHGPYSHTSEEVYRFLPDMSAVLDAESPQLPPSPSEILAKLLIESSASKRFFRRIGSRYDVVIEPSEVADLILGRGRVGLRGYLTDVLNGAFDGDKLDYIARDGHFSGLPLSLDIDRLYYAMQVHLITRRHDPDVKRRMRRLLVSASGVTSVEQIAFARMVLTSSVYHHHKVRAADCMVKALFRAAAASTGIRGRSMRSPVDYVDLTDRDVLAEAHNGRADQRVRSLAEALMNRRLWKRALVIAMTTVAAAESDGAPRMQEIIANANSLITQKRIDDLVRDIWRAAGRPCRPHEIALDFPRKPKVHDLGGLHINVGSRDKPKFRKLSNYFPLDQWSAQYMLNRWRGHVFCPPHCARQVSRAAKGVLEDALAIKFSDDATSLAKLM